jgi:chromosome segregation ATPase
LKEFLYDRRDSFIQWFEPHVSRRFGDALIDLYNQLLEQLEAESEALEASMVERFGQEMRWVKVILSLKAEIASLEQNSKMKAEDHKAELSDLKREMDRRQEDSKVEAEAQRALIWDLQETLEKVGDRFDRVKAHFDRAAARADHLEHEKYHVEGDLARARDRLKALEEEISRVASEDKEHYGLYTQSRKEVERLNG